MSQANSDAASTTSNTAVDLNATQNQEITFRQSVGNTNVIKPTFIGSKASIGTGIEFMPKNNYTNVVVRKYKGIVPTFVLNETVICSKLSLLYMLFILIIIFIIFKFTMMTFDSNLKRIIFTSVLGLLASRTIFVV